ncbi:MAG: hypothetical protein JSR86_17585 [Proteobacteria bacterium]|nr:hypothetical protein [Pseudomonadota bacterium]
MKKILLAIAAVGALGAALPAAAAPWDRGGYGNYGAAGVDERIREINFRIDRGVRDGSLNWREARGLRGELDGVRRLQYRYSRDGLNGWERADLNARLDRVSYRVRSERHDDDRRGDDRRDHRW